MQLSGKSAAPLGFSALLLHQERYRKLMSETGQRGTNVEKLPLRVSEQIKELNCINAFTW